MVRVRYEQPRAQLAHAWQSAVWAVGRASKSAAWRGSVLCRVRCDLCRMSRSTTFLKHHSTFDRIDMHFDGPLERD